MTFSTQSGAFRQPSEFAHGRGWISRVINRILPAPAVTWCGEVTPPAMFTMALIPIAAEATAAEAPDITMRRGDPWCVWDLPVADGTVCWLTSVDTCMVDE